MDAFIFLGALLSCKANAMNCNCNHKADLCGSRLLVPPVLNLIDNHLVRPLLLIVVRRTTSTYKGEKNTEKSDIFQCSERD
jgi:hypothetical protein